MSLQGCYTQSYIDLEILQNDISELRQQIRQVECLSEKDLPEFSKKFLLFDLEKQYKSLVIKLDKEKEKIAIRNWKYDDLLKEENA